MLKVGEVVDGKYRVERLLGQGGMGAVFEGYHLLIERRVAIKVLLPEVTASSEGAVRFDREIRAAGRIGNEHILEVFDVGSLPDGSRYMVSEFLSGETLGARIQRGPLSAQETAGLMLQLLDGLAAAHAAGIVHRDLKPDNIFLLKRKSGHGDFVKIIDFGVSKYKPAGEQALSMTTTGALVGTPHYLSPEQARGDRDIDARSDLFTVGVIMFQAVAGRVPVRAKTFNELLFKIALEPAPKLSEEVPGVDPAFSALLEKSMAREREARFQSASELAAALELWLSGNSTSAAPLKAAGQSRRPSGAATVKSPSLATSSNFGRTDAQPSPVRSARPPRGLVFAAIGAGLVVLAGLVLAFARRAGPEPVASGVAPSPSPSELTQLEAPVASVPPAADPGLAPIDAPLAEMLPRPRVAPPKPSLPPASSHAIAPAVPPPAQEPAPVQAQDSQPAPAPSSAPRGRHDFGY
jgi:serine/threonine protein kinase